MLDAKLFVNRLDGAFRDLYELFWDGDEWIWVNHGRPGGTPVTGSPGAAMLNEKLFVVVEDGSLWERHWRGDVGRWVWEGHGRPGNRRIVLGPGAAMMNRKLFVVADDGHLYERYWNGSQWVWVDHGSPPGAAVTTAPGAAMMNQKLFVGANNGRLYERYWTGSQWVWVDHGSPPGTAVTTAPGAAMMDQKLFVGTSNGRLYERYWNGNQWVWVDHGSPPGAAVATAPGAAMMNRKLFVGASNGHLFERHWDGSQWLWSDHGAPPGTSVHTAPGAAMLNSKLFVGTRDGRLFERSWDGVQWNWLNRGSAMHDDASHVIGAPGTDPKLTIAVMGDGFAEGDLSSYRQLVDSDVVRALQSDALSSRQTALRVVRVDLVSVDSGASERRYDSMGAITSEVLLETRLGVIPNDDWNRLWFDRSAFTDARIEKLRRRFAPTADHVLILVNSPTFGGLSSVGPGVGFFTRGSGWETIAHELGHNLFALDDEYVSAALTFTGTSARANTTEAPASWTVFKWAALVSAGATLPSDPNNLPTGWNARTSVGAFEGAGGWFSTGLFRPVLECRMNQNHPPWCPVCARKIAADLAVFQ